MNVCECCCHTTGWGGDISLHHCCSQTSHWQSNEMSKQSIGTWHNAKGLLAIDAERNALKAEVDELKKSQAFWEEARFTADGEIRRWKEVAGRYREALEKIVARKLEDLPNDKKKDEFHETLMAVAAWTYCGFVAHSALLEKS